SKATDARVLLCGKSCNANQRGHKMQRESNKSEETGLENLASYDESPDGHNSQAAKEELPMIVWLRGDEEIASEFTVDAEAAMEFLGIKRSRLTQISGRELRVGRMRIDRYIRPV